MARNSTKPEPMDDLDTPEPEQPPEPEAPRGPDDVLCYVEHMGPLTTYWNDPPKGSKVGGLVVPAQTRVRIEPGLSFCPGALWPMVKATQGWTDRVARRELRAVAGQGGNLVAEWAALKPGHLVAMLGKTFHLPALERLREMEGKLERPRLKVVAEIDARLADMADKIKGRQAQRKAHRAKRILG